MPVFGRPGPVAPAPTPAVRRIALLEELRAPEGRPRERADQLSIVTEEPGRL